VPDGQDWTGDRREEARGVRAVVRDARNGFATASTGTSRAARSAMTPFQLEQSAKAPWTSTTVTA
jgi:hypothetical protein